MTKLLPDPADAAPLGIANVLVKDLWRKPSGFKSRYKCFDAAPPLFELSFCCSKLGSDEDIAITVWPVGEEPEMGRPIWFLFWFGIFENSEQISLFMNVFGFGLKTQI